jgi:Fanconi anemia group M protein
MGSLSLLVPLRKYQENIAKTCLGHNTLIVLPTGLGKTLLAFSAMCSFKKVLFLAPTKPLCKQHVRSFLSQTDANDDDVALLSGETKAEKRSPLYAKKYVFATPQTIQKDAEKNPGPLSQFDLVVFDECHRAVGNYAYSFVAKGLSPSCRKVGMTASPGSDKAKVMEIIGLLDIDYIEYRREEDDDVSEHVHKKEFSWIYVSLDPEMKRVQLLLKDLEARYVEALRSMGLPVVMKRSLLVALGNVISKVKSNARYRMFMLYSMILNLDHIITLFETEGIFSTLRFVSDLIKEKGDKKSIRELMASKELAEARQLMGRMMEKGEEHPKVDRLVSMFGKELKGKKCMVFVQYVEQAKYLAGLLSKKGYPAQFFIGKRKEYSRQQQEQTLQDFRDGKFNVLVASSIGEEGIDIPSTDAVIFYEPVPSEIRLIQRRGRTGRAHKGEVYILITKGTRDEAYHWASKRKESRMFSLMDIINDELGAKRNARERVIVEHRAMDAQKREHKVKVAETESVNEKSGLQKKLNDYF